MLVNSLRAVMTTLLSDVKNQENTPAFETQFADYMGALRPSLIQYQEPDTTALTDEELRARFEYETALLHLVTHFLAEKAQLPIHLAWPIFENDSSFSWYHLPDTILPHLQPIKNQLNSVAKPGIALAQASGELLNRAERKYLGEFHTPLSLVEHLIELSTFESVDLFDGQTVVDPACGSGIILAVLANKVIDWGLEADIPPSTILNTLQAQLHGFDIQPFAIELARSLLLYTCQPLLVELNPIDQALFSNIRLLDPLTASGEFWGENRHFRYVIGNPPYLHVRQNQLDLAAYKPIIKGHVNLYQLFLWWAIRATQTGGVVSFLIPQSILAGSYFERLRERITEEAEILGITRMIDRKGVVGDADLQMMALSLRVSEEAHQRPDIELRVTRNGDDIEKAHMAYFPYARVVQRINQATFWTVSDQALDYEIAEALGDGSELLINMNEQLQCRNGGFVWNQRKAMLYEFQEQGTIPLISAASIQAYRIVFPYIGSHRSRTRQYSNICEKFASDLRSGPAILMQRTTPRKVGRRLHAGLLGAEFCDVHPYYYLENHVNYIVSVGNDMNLLYGMTAWLNSDLINFLFQLRNGTPHISVLEIGLLPVNLDLVRSVVEPARELLARPLKEQPTQIRAINECLFERLNLSPQHRARIEEVLNRRETRE